MGLVSSLHIDEPNDYCAQIVDSEANGAVGYFAMQIFEGVATYSYQLDLSNFKIKTCDLSNGLVSTRDHIGRNELLLKS